MGLLYAETPPSPSDTTTTPPQRFTEKKVLPPQKKTTQFDLFHKYISASTLSKRYAARKASREGKPFHAWLPQNPIDRSNMYESGKVQL